MRRAHVQRIISDLQKKMVFVVGPRQVGKTWVAKEVMKSYTRALYLTYDDPSDREQIRKRLWDPTTDLLVLDEIHKMSGWKNFVKGIYDTKPPHMHILVTGSARLHEHARMGDSMAGRYFVHHLLPLSVREVAHTEHAHTLTRLLERSGFPEPFLAQDARDADRWRIRYNDTLLREDVLDFATVEDIRALEDVVILLRRSVGSPISYASIAQNIGKSPITVKRYIRILEALYIVFIVRPYTHKVARAILKEPKVYFFDYASVPDPAARLENMVGLSLLTHVYHSEDVLGKRIHLNYIRTKQGNEVDFTLSDANNALLQFIEVKSNDTSLAKNLSYFSTKYSTPGVQVVHNLRNDIYHSPTLSVRDVSRYLQELDV